MNYFHLFRDTLNYVFNTFYINKPCHIMVTLTIINISQCSAVNYNIWIEFINYRFNVISICYI